MAQLAEQLICNQQVIGSSPIVGLRKSYVDYYYIAFLVYKIIDRLKKLEHV